MTITKTSIVYICGVNIIFANQIQCSLDVNFYDIMTWLNTFYSNKLHYNTAYLIAEPDLYVFLQPMQKSSNVFPIIHLNACVKTNVSN